MEQKEILLACKSEVEKYVEMLKEDKRFKFDKEVTQDLIYFAFNDCMTWVNKGKEITDKHIKYFVRKNMFEGVPYDNKRKRKMISLISSDDGIIYNI